MNGKKMWPSISFAILFFIMGLAVGTADKVAAESFKVCYEVVDTAQITDVKYFIAKYEGAPRLHFEVTIKNVTNEPRRYRLNIFLPEGPAGGGLYPLSKKAIEPGKELKQKYPMYFDTLPTGYTMVVKELPAN
jgi:hypothetical protein